MQQCWKMNGEAQQPAAAPYLMDTTHYCTHVSIKLQVMLPLRGMLKPPESGVLTQSKGCHVMQRNECICPRLQVMLPCREMSPSVTAVKRF